MHGNGKDCHYQRSTALGLNDRLTAVDFSGGPVTGAVKWDVPRNVPQDSRGTRRGPDWNYGICAGWGLPGSANVFVFRHFTYLRIGVGQNAGDKSARHGQVAHNRQYALLPLVRQVAHMCRYALAAEGCRQLASGHEPLETGGDRPLLVDHEHPWLRGEVPVLGAGRWCGFSGTGAKPGSLNPV